MTISASNAFGFEEVISTRFDSIGSNDLTPYFENGRRPGKHNYGLNVVANQFLAGGHLSTRVQNDDINLPILSAFFWFNSDLPLTINTLLAHKRWGQPIWSIEIVDGKLVFETSDGNMCHWLETAEPSVGVDHFVGISLNIATKQKLLYFDGAIIDTAIAPHNAIPTDPVGISFGTLVDGGRPFDGMIDSAVIVPYILTSDQWDEVYDNGAGRDISYFLPKITRNTPFFLLKREKIELMEHSYLKPIEREEIPQLEE
jgi:hypothetical protein